MPALSLDLDTIEQGATWVKNFYIMLPDKVTPVDTTGATFRMQIREKVTSPNFITELSTANGKIVHDPATGAVTMTLPATETAVFTFKQGVFDIELTYPDGVIERVWEGGIALSLNVTR